MKQHKVYLITNQVNGKQYVGKTSVPFSLRFERHVSQSRNADKYLHSINYAIKKYGAENFNIELIESFQKTQMLETHETKKVWN